MKVVLKGKDLQAFGEALLSAAERLGLRVGDGISFGEQVGDMSALDKLRACIDAHGVWPSASAEDDGDYEGCVRHMSQLLDIARVSSAQSLFDSKEVDRLEDRAKYLGCQLIGSPGPLFHVRHLTTGAKVEAYGVRNLTCVLDGVEIANWSTGTISVTGTRPEPPHPDGI